MGKGRRQQQPEIGGEADVTEDGKTRQHLLIKL
jgi:hypothetical protein